MHSVVETATPTLTVSPGGRSRLSVVKVSRQLLPAGHAGVVPRAAGAHVHDGSVGEDLVVDVGRKLVLP